MIWATVSSWSCFCGSSARQLYGGVNGNLLQEGLAHRLCDTDLLHPESLPLWQATADSYLHRRQTIKGRCDSVSLGSLGPCAHKVLFEPTEHLWWVWGLILNMISPLLSCWGRSCWGFSFPLGHGVSFFCGIQHSPVNGCSQQVVILKFLQEKMHTRLLLCHFNHTWEYHEQYEKVTMKTDTKAANFMALTTGKEQNCLEYLE